MRALFGDFQIITDFALMTAFVKLGRKRAALISFVGNAANILVLSVQAALLIPLYVKHIGQKLYGAWLGSGDLLTWIQVFDLGLPNLLTQRIGAAHGKGDEASAKRYLATGVVLMAAICVLVLVVSLALASGVPSWMGLHGTDAAHFRRTLQVATAATVLVLFNNLFLGYSRAVQDTEFLSIATIIASLAALAISSVLIIKGFRLWAISIGLVCRAIVCTTASLIFLWKTRARLIGITKAYDREVAWELLRITPSATLGGASYILLNQSEVFLVASISTPEAAVIFSLTRKLVEIARAVVDMIPFAVYAGFAHLVSSDDRRRALQVFSQIYSFRLSIALSIAAAVMMLNESFMTMWIGDKYWGGRLLTTLFALQFLVAGQSFLVNYLYRASGFIKEGSMALFYEALVRILLSAALLFGLGGCVLPAVAILTSLFSHAIIRKRLILELRTPSEPKPKVDTLTGILRASILACSFVMPLFMKFESWVSLVGAGLTVLLASFSLQVASDRVLRSTLLELTKRGHLAL